MNMHALIVRKHLIHKTWPLVMPAIRNACRKGKSDFNESFVHECLLTGDMEMFVAFDYDDAKSPLGLWIIEIVETARGRCCHLMLTAKLGGPFSRWKHLIADIKTYARQRGCNRIECGGRLGWERHLPGKGWKKLWVVMEMRLDNA